MNEDIIKLNITGTIRKGESKDWFLRVQEDFGSSDSYLILIFNHKDINKASEVYDYWAEDFSTVEQIFKESNWQIDWTKGVEL